MSDRTQRTTDRTICEQLAAEHRELEAWLAHVLASPYAVARARFDQLATRLVAHVDREIKFVYARLRPFRPGHDRVVDALANLHVAIEELRRDQVTPSEWLRAVRRFDVTLRHYVEIEERELFAAVRDVLAIEESRELARNFARIPGAMS